MKAVIQNDEEAVNPVFLKTPGPGVQQRIVVPAGTIVDDPNAWQMCVLRVPKAAPADDECRERVAKFLGNDRRRKLLQDIKALRAASGVKTLDAKTTKWLEFMEESYAKDLAETVTPPALTAIPEADSDSD